MTLDGRVVLVTGGSRGIGRAIVTGAVARGARVAFCCRTLGDDSDRALAEAYQLGGPECAVAVRADVADEADVEAFFDVAIARFGRVDAVIHNAGINRDELLVRASVERFEEVVGVNLTGAFLVARRAVREFAGSGGRVVFIGSMSDRGMTSQAAYAASKGGLLGLARTLALEHPSITANVVVVGFVQTAMTEHLADEHRAAALGAALRRPGQPDEVASVVLHLASEQARFVNGETVYASGGLVELNV